MTRIITMPQQISPIAAPGSLLKRPHEKQRRKFAFTGVRETDSYYLALIRELPCLRCGVEPCREAAHVRMNCAALGKRQAMGAKPDDCWTVPLCNGCHVRDPDSQHRVGEQQFWHDVGLKPLLVCQDLQKAAPDLLKMRAVVFNWIAVRE